MTSKSSSKKTWIDGNILILGDGYIGNSIFNFLKGRSNPKMISSKVVNYHDVNILSKYILNNSIDIIINCSGFTGRPNVDEGESRKGECWELNVVSPLRVNTICEKFGVKYVHISSGCIYTGYYKKYTEQDIPNFGMFHDSSFYSKSKHAFEIMTRHLNNKILRIRMPICNDLNNPRNYLNKIMTYENLINYNNSKTYIPDLCNFIYHMLTDSNLSWSNKQDIYNVVNGEALNTSEVVDLLNNHNEGGWKNINPNWVDIDKLIIVAPRSNCILDTTKSENIYKMHSETEVINMVCNFNNNISAV